MNHQQEIELINSLIAEDSNVTIKDFIEAKTEIERIEAVTDRFFSPRFAKINRMLTQTKGNHNAA